ncbi:MAG: M20/M25/M40 family metallo-hydrolase [Lachnospiraceae bacterium]|nr:M20/M25/M40 family metallo-hydrolase [Lachnospiraceae bacterium]
MKIDEKRLLREFTELVELDSLSFRERKAADYVKGKLEELGFEVSEDDAGTQYGGNAGNVYGFLKGTLPGETILFSSHLDTVEPGKGKRPVLSEDGRITSAGDTVLGADDVSGIVEILGGIRGVCGSGRPHRDIEVLFPVAEEVYVKGTKVFDFSKVRAREAYVLDLSGAVGAAALQAPSLLSFEITVTGRASHAGFSPEEGIHAIAVAGSAISKIRQGRIDPETTLNIGKITGGQATNIVPELCRCEGEIRSYSHQKALQTAREVQSVFEAEAAGAGAECRTEIRVDLTAYKIPREAAVVQRFERACERLGLPAHLTRTFGGSDNNTFAEQGIQGIVLSCGMYDSHSTSEYTTVTDLKRGAELVAELILQ